MIFILKVASVTMWFLGLFFIEDRALLWSLPAGFAAGSIFGEFIIWLQRGRFTETLIIDSRTSDLPPEVKARMDEVIDILKKSGKLPADKKCDDPHCKNCWGLADNDEPKV